MTFLEESCLRVWEAFGVSTVVALGFVGVVCALSASGKMPSFASRKLLHIGIGPLFVLCWRLFPTMSVTETAIPALCRPRCVAALLPAAITLVFAAIGLALLPSDLGLVRVMARSGTDAAEILRGPLIYGLAHVALTLACWTDGPAGVLAVATLCGGDGLAEVCGRRWGRATGPVPWAARRRKTVAGSLGFVAASFVLANALLAALAPAPWTGAAPDQLRLLLVCAAAALVETVPVHEIDNALVPLATVLIARFLW